MNRLVGAVVMMTLATSALAQNAADLDRAILELRSSTGDKPPAVADLWACLAASGARSRVVDRATILAQGGKADIRVTLKNDDGQNAEFAFQLDAGRARLYRIATPQGVIRKRILLDEFLSETCSF